MGTQILSITTHSLSRLSIAAAVFLWLTAPGIAAQTSASDDLARADRFRNAGNLSAALEVLQTRLALEPDNGDVARVLAQTLYWLKDIEGARVAYEAALLRHPQDTSLRVQYGRMLVETRQADRARELLTPLRMNPVTQTEASALLGTLAYWEGDLAAAKTLFEETLRLAPGHADAARQLGEIRAISSPWMRISSRFGRDDQPLERLAFGFEGGWFPRPLSPVTIRVEPSRHVSNDSTRRFASAEVAVSHVVPAARLETDLAMGVMQRSTGDTGSDWTGRAGLGVRLSRSVTFRARAERSTYLYTTSSLDSSVLVNSGTALLHWQNSRGWLGEGAYQYQRLPDDNTIRVAYAWQLVPIVYRTRAELQGGYAFTAEDAGQSRFVLAFPSQPFQPGDPRFNTSGRYVPYYTPSHLMTHSTIVAGTVRTSSGAAMRIGAAYGFRATEDAPAFAVSAGEVQRVLTSRTFSPWNVRASVDVAVSRTTTLSLSGEHGQTAFYQWSTAGVQVTHRFRATP